MVSNKTWEQNRKGENKMLKFSQYLKYGGIVVGIIAVLTLISRAPVNVAFIGLGAAIYFAGKWYDKQGK